jgi:hypothetical protein
MTIEQEITCVYLKGNSEFRAIFGDTQTRPVSAIGFLLVVRNPAERAATY